MPVLIIETSQTLNFNPEVFGLDSVLLQANVSVRFDQNGRVSSQREAFQRLADQWRRETRFSSSLHEKVLHHAYQSIIAMGPSALPLVLTELECNRGHWFWALRFMAGFDPAPEGANVEVARQAWLKWGRAKGLLK